MTTKKALGRTVVGKVISNKMQKTIVVSVESKVKHPLYGKYVKQFSKMYAEDANNSCRINDIVLIQETKPISKLKSWTLVKVLEQAEKEVTL